MPIKLAAPLSKIRVHTQELTENAKNAIVSVLTDVGLQCVIEARNSNGYTDQTANLRSSIGFVVTRDGEIVERVLANQIGDGKPSTQEGMTNADKALERLAARHASGICLIVVAGMNYAVYVEGRGRNVLTSSELLAERIIPKMLTDLGIEIKEK